MKNTVAVKKKRYERAKVRASRKKSARFKTLRETVADQNFYSLSSYTELSELVRAAGDAAISRWWRRVPCCRRLCPFRQV
ncbi:MAG: hypothetical protein Q8Q81_05025 [Oxalobacteraceae bacterium]|nr:hypothetical protein [Oxalobacteraceae bacterium]